MATDTAQIVRELVAFYDFGGKTVIAVGAGGGQLAEYGRQARHVIAVDPDEAALERLVTRLEERGLADRFTLVREDLLRVELKADVVLFEFCLHEMPDQERALDHAATLAPHVLVIDHAPGSPWMWYAAEEGGVKAGWAAVGRRSTRRQRDVEAFQRFPDYAELEERMARQPPECRERISGYRSRTPIVIPMPYRLTLL